MRVYLVDNYDSFTFNLVELLRRTGIVHIRVVRNDRVDFAEVGEYDKILISPGPGLPSGAGKTLALLHQFAPTKSILGICLGHQAIACAFGGNLRRLNNILHGIASDIFLTDSKENLFYSMPQTIHGGRYHSWVVDEGSLPASLTVTAYDREGNIMALRHNALDVKGVQFHPESYMTAYGQQIMHNWIYHDKVPAESISAL